MGLPRFSHFTRTLMEDNAMSTYSINIAGRTFAIDIDASRYERDEDLFDALYERAMNLHEQADAEAAVADPEIPDTGNVLAAWSTVNYR